mmetsp:Transcript_21805/g.53852  ORF Transcript_21805/g.53852 Transcript_21805/m.53852 type:complete len:146 (-) Transcript_21805:44-481(-)
MFMAGGLDVTTTLNAHGAPKYLLTRAAAGALVHLDVLITLSRVRLHVVLVLSEAGAPDVLLALSAAGGLDVFLGLSTAGGLCVLLTRTYAKGSMSLSRSPPLPSSARPPPHTEAAALGREVMPAAALGRVRRRMPWEGRFWQRLR